MGALQALIPLGIITAALGVGGNLLGVVPWLFHGEVRDSPLRAFCGLRARLHVFCCRARACRARNWLASKFGQAPPARAASPRIRGRGLLSNFLRVPCLCVHSASAGYGTSGDMRCGSGTR